MKRHRGFTLIELLVVIAIIALLSSVVLASLGTARMKGRDARRLSDMSQVELALEMFYDANGYYPGVWGSGTCSASAPGTWDCNGYMKSYAGNWPDLETALKPFIAKLPIDPINSNCAPFNTPQACYSYVYGNVGRYTNPATYDLFARLETPNHPQSCKYTKGSYGRGAFGAATAVCPESGAGGILPSEVYSYSP